MTVLFLISSEGYFGMENMLVTLGVALTKLGCRCVVGVFCDSRVRHTEVADRARQQGLTVEEVPCDGRCDLHAVVTVGKLLDEYGVDVLHAHGYKADLYARAARWRYGAALVATCHNWPSPLLRMRLYAVLDRLSLRGFDRVVVPSPHIGEILRHSGIRARKLETIFNGVEIEPYMTAMPTLPNGMASSDHSVVGFVGRLVPEKGGEILMRAAEQVLRIRPSTKFVVVGEGPSRKHWECLASRLGIRSHVIFAGFREDMPGVYASLQLIVLPSLCEAMPMCVLEAMAAGKPVIATRVGMVPKLIVPGKTGLLVDPGDVSGLSASIVKVLDDPGLAHRLGESGREYAVQHFSAGSMAKRYLGLYEEVADMYKHAKKGSDLNDQRLHSGDLNCRSLPQ